MEKIEYKEVKIPDYIEKVLEKDFVSLQYEIADNYIPINFITFHKFILQCK